MTKLKEAILRIVESHPGINSVKLVTDVAGIINPAEVDAEIYNAILNKLIKDKDILELEYILPDMSYRLKSIYFPKGTEFILERLQ